MAAKTIEERIATIEQKIQKKQDEIAVLEAQRQRLLHPVNMRSVLTKAKEAGYTPEQIAAKLGIEV